MWASCCNWFCLDGQPEETPPPQGARTQAYSNPGYSSFPSPTGSEPSCKACGVHFASTTRKSVDSEDSFVPGRRASLSDLTHLEDIEGLTVRQLKEILARNFVNYKGCCEKWELMERVTRLYKDQKGLQHLVSGNEDQNGGAVPSGLEENLCKICMDSPIDCVLLECGHMVTCTKCGKRMNECPICRQYVIRAVHVFRS